MPYRIIRHQSRPCGELCPIFLESVRQHLAAKGLCPRLACRFEHEPVAQVTGPNPVILGHSLGAPLLHHGTGINDDGMVTDTQRCLDRVAALCERFPLYADSKQPVLA